MTHNRVRDIKHAQRESQLLKRISEFLQQITLDNPDLQNIYIHRARLSADRKHCAVFFHAQGGLEEFERVRPTLVLYTPSLRKALAQQVCNRGVPELRYVYDAEFEKQRRVSELIDGLKQDGKL